MQPRQQCIDAASDALPVLQPVAREAEGDVGCADAPFQQAIAVVGDAAARAARQEMLRPLRFEYQFLALIRRAVAERTQRQAGRAGRKLRAR